ncbi:unnamed protein product, partial [Effrenium voratum]
RTCLRTWATKQHSARIRSWLSEPKPGRGDPEESWKARYVLALKDRHRCRILPEELCWDAARDGESGRPLPRRWHLKMHLGRWVDKEVIFSPGGGSLADFDFRVLNFRVFQELPWRPPGEEQDDLDLGDGVEDADEESQGSLPSESEVSGQDSHVPDHDLDSDTPRSEEGESRIEETERSERSERMERMERVPVPVLSTPM